MALPKPLTGTAPKAGSKPPHSRPIALLKTGLSTTEKPMPDQRSDRSQTYAKVLKMI